MIWPKRAQRTCLGMGLVAAVAAGCAPASRGVWVVPIDVSVKAKGGDLIIAWDGSPITGLIVGRCVDRCEEKACYEGEESTSCTLVPEPRFMDPLRWSLRATDDEACGSQGSASPIVYGQVPDCSDEAVPKYPYELQKYALEGALELDKDALYGLYVERGPDGFDGIGATAFRGDQ